MQPPKKHISRTPADALVKAICFYLPQYHPVPENDEWWGKGFTEWRNVVKARPQFPEHNQPHIPADLGFYDLRLPEAREAQAALAKEYGIHGFCYYHYWFNGRRILERPFTEVLNSGNPDFPFCLCWANENWSRRWDGSDEHRLLEQTYSSEDDLAHIQSLIPVFKDNRYIRINGKPLLLVYRTSLLPDPARTAEIWRTEAARAGIGDLYLVCVESFAEVVDPASISFDASVEFAPFGGMDGARKFYGKQHQLFANLGLLAKGYVENIVFDYKAMAQRMAQRSDVPWTRFRCATPSWDNSARRKSNAVIFHGSTPEAYEAWLATIVKQTNSKRQGDERIVFINAWNEWAEANHLEPDLKWGRAYLEATRRALLTEDSEQATSIPKPIVMTQPPSFAKSAYWKTRHFLKGQLELLAALGFKKK